MVNMCETFSWTAEQYRNTNLFDLEVFGAVMNGRNKASKKP